MANKSHIVSYEDARRASYERRRSVASSSRVSSGRARYATSAYGYADYPAYAEGRSRRMPSYYGEVSAPQPRSRAGVSSPAESREATSEPVKKKGFFARSEERKKAKAKAKAERKYHQQFQKDQRGATPQDGAGAGPRAAVYRGEMGAQQRRAARIQDQNRAASGQAAIKTRRAPRPFALGIVAVSVCLACSCLFLYPSAQRYYVTVREYDRLQAEYQAVLDRNGALQSRLDSLSTDDGLRQYAHEEFGWVSEGEHAVVVYGITDGTENSLSDIDANVVAGSVPAPETWYSSTLDPLFGYER